MPSRQLSTADLAAARQAYEAGASYRELRSRYGTSNSTIRVMLAAVGVTSRPQGWPPRPKSEPAPPPQPAVEITPDVTGRLRIPWRTREERRMRRWTPAERQAIAVELAAGRVQRVRRGRSGLPERPSIAQRRDAEISFWRVLQRVKAAA
jgi:transposase-like protein